MDSKAFFKTLDEEEEYMILMIPKRDYMRLPDNIRECVYISGVNQNTSKFKNDPLHKELRKAEKQAKKERKDYEYLKNNK